MTAVKADAVGWETTGDLWTVCLRCAPSREAARRAWGTTENDYRLLVSAVSREYAVSHGLTCDVCGRRLAERLTD